jgi:DNA modification methylase
METDIIHTEDCLVTMKEHIDEKSVDIVLTSPPYCTCNRGGSNSKNNLSNETHSNPKFYPTMRYDVFNDNMSPEEYIDWTVNLFESFDRILKKDGCILYNISYSSTRRDMLFLTISAILQRTDFSIADMIIWKKRTALPNNTSPNKLTRIVEPVFVFARRDEMDTFICNKKVVSVRERTGQKMYENVYNFIEAANNDGMCKLNRATYSSELCEKLLGLYGRSGMTVYDPFMGTGTTAVACKRLGMHYIGSEISEAQTKFANNRICSDSGIPGDYEKSATVESEESESMNEIKAKKPRKSHKKSSPTPKCRFEQMELFDENLEPLVDVNNETSNKMNSDGKDTRKKLNEHENEKKVKDDGQDSLAEENGETKAGLYDEEGYILNGYFHSHSTCPVDDDEFE